MAGTSMPLERAQSRISEAGDQTVPPHGRPLEDVS